MTNNKVVIYPSGYHGSFAAECMDMLGYEVLMADDDAYKIGKQYKKWTICSFSEISSRLCSEMPPVVACASDEALKQISEKLKSNNIRVYPLGYYTISAANNEIIKIKKFFNGKPLIAINDPAYNKTLDGLAKKLVESGKYGVFYLNHEIGCAYDFDFHQVYVEPESWIKLEGFDLLLSSGYCTKIANIPSVVFPHGLMSSSGLSSKNGIDVDIEAYRHYAENYNYVATSNKNDADIFEAIFEYFKQKNYTTTKNGVIKLGYAKLDKVVAQDSENIERDTIIYAPTLTRDGASGNTLNIGSNFLTHGSRIINELTKVAEKYRIVVRLYKDDYDRFLARGFDDELLKSLDSVIVSSSSESYLELYKRAVVLVTDVSSTAYSFSLGQLRPSVFIETGDCPTELRLGDNILKIGYMLNRCEIGEVLKDISDLSFVLSKVILADGFYREKIKRFRGSYFYNLGCSMEKFVNIIDKIIIKV